MSSINNTEKEYLNQESSSNQNKNSNSSNPNNNITTFNFENNFLQHPNCSCYTLGNSPIYQPYFICTICSPKKNEFICEYCYKTCHQQCRDSLSRDSTIIKEESAISGYKDFACFCGINLKHIPKKIEKKEITKCNLKKLDDALDVYNFFCQSHQKQICCICSFVCHKYCMVKVEKNEINDGECFCQNEKHTIYNDIIFLFNINEYVKRSSKNVWPIQILNIIFKNNIGIENLKELITQNFNNNEKNYEQFKYMIKLFSKQYFPRKLKTFYYQDDIKNLFNYEKLIQFIKKIKTDNSENIFVKLRLISILFYVHVRTDFQYMKHLTSFDFLSNFLLERLIYKKILATSSTYTEKIFNKYSLKNILSNKTNNFKEIIVKDLCELIEIAIDYIDLIENKNIFIISLKHMSFFLKKTLCNKEDLIKIIKSLYIFYNKFYDYINNKDSDIENNIYHLVDMFNYIVEIIFIICVNYNDITISEFLDEYKNNTIIKNEIDNFTDLIHVNSEHGNMLFTILLKSSFFLKKHYELVQKNGVADNKFLSFQNNFGENIKFPKNGGIFFEKTLKIFVETMGIFCKGDNIYYNQINSLDEKDVNDYYKIIGKIGDDSHDKLNTKEHRQLKEIINTIKNNIENKLNILFNSSYNSQTNQINDEINELLKEFSLQINEIIKNYAQRKKIKITKNSEDTFLEYIIANKEQQKENENSENKIYIRKVNNFLNKISNKLSKSFNFLSENIFNNICDEIVDYFILSNIDETLFKILFFFTNRKYELLLTNDLLNIIYSILSLYFYSRRGVKYFLLGKNLTRLNKIINRFCYKQKNKFNIYFVNKSVEFLLDISKAINIYKISIKNHKALLRYKKTLLDHLTLFNAEAQKNENDFITQLKQIIKIFTLLNEDYEIEDFTQIKKQIIFIMKQCPLNLLSKESFFKFFSTLPNKESDINNDNKSENNIDNKSENDSEKNNSNDKNSDNDIIDNKSEDEKINDDGNASSQREKLLLKDNASQNSNNNSSNKKKIKIKKKQKIKNKNSYIVSLYFSFMNFISIKSFYIYKNLKEDCAAFHLLHIFTNNSEIKKNFQLNNFSIKQKIILLKYLRSIYLINEIDLYDIFIKKNELNNSEFDLLLHGEGILDKKLEESLEKRQLTLPADVMQNLLKKYNLANSLKTIVEIIIEEIDQFPKQIIKIDIDISEKYYKQLMLEIKFLTNYFYLYKNMWSNVKILFYELCKSFLEKVEIFRNAYNCFKKRENEVFYLSEEYYLVPLDRDPYIELEHRPVLQKKYFNNVVSNLGGSKEFRETLEGIVTIIKKLKSSKFNMYNEKKLYSYLTEYLDVVFKLSDMENIYTDIKKYFEHCNVLVQGNFTSYSLLQKLNYEFFYNTEDEKNKINYLKNHYINTFIDVNNTNFLNVLQFENLFADYKKKYIEFFENFLSSNEGNYSNKLKVLLCILAKMMLYNNKDMHDKIDNRSDNNLFTNLNIILNYYINIVITLSNNIFAYDYMGDYVDVIKIIVQFLQTLAKNYNNIYNINIFEFLKQKDGIDPNELDENMNNILEDYLDEGQNRINRNKKRNVANKGNNNDNKIYFSKSLISVPSVKINKSIYDSIIVNLKYILSLINVNDIINSELPYDKLIILIPSLINFITEFITSENDYSKNIIRTNINNILLGNESNQDNTEKNSQEILNEKEFLYLLFIKIEKNLNDNEVDNDFINENKLYILRKKIVCYLKIKFIDIIIFNLLSNTKKEMILNLYKNNCTPISLFSEIIYNLSEVEFVQKFNNKYKKTEDYIEKLIELYKHEKEFRKLIELQLILKYFILIQIFQDKYGYNELQIHFKNLEKNFETQSKNEKKELININTDYKNIYTKYSYCIFKFLEKLISKVEIQVNENLIEKQKKYEMNKKQIVKTIIANIKQDNLLNKLKKYGDGDNESTDEENNNCIDDIDNFENLGGDKIKAIYFIKPYLTFFLSKQCERKFVSNIENYNKLNSMNKKKFIMFFGDYCLYEMIINKHLCNDSKFKKFLANMNFYILEIINYIIIILNNIFIIKHFYQKPTLPTAQYEVFDMGKINDFYFFNMIISIVQVLFDIFYLVIWYLFQYYNSYQYKVILEYENPFLYNNRNISKNIVNYFREKKGVSTSNMYSEANKKLSTWKKLYIGIFEVNLFNREINMIILTFLFNAIYLASRYYIFLVTPILFIMNIIPSLFDIYKILKQKIIKILLLTAVTVLIIYIFAFCGFFYFSGMFLFNNVLDTILDTTVTEGYCYSSLQCLFYFIGSAIKFEGGVGSFMNGLVSYKNDEIYFTKIFFYDIFFFWGIFIFCGGIFFGIIYEGVLNNDKDKINNKKENNKCFICGLKEDDCLNNGIDFDNHKNKVHNIWNYVDFLTYLYVNDSNDFNGVENSVWEKIQMNDLNWIPDRKNY